MIKFNITERMTLPFLEKHERPRTLQNASRLDTCIKSIASLMSCCRRPIFAAKVLRDMIIPSILETFQKILIKNPLAKYQVLVLTDNYSVTEGEKFIRTNWHRFQKSTAFQRWNELIPKTEDEKIKYLTSSLIFGTCMGSTYYLFDLMDTHANAKTRIIAEKLKEENDSILFLQLRYKVGGDLLLLKLIEANEKHQEHVEIPPESEFFTEAFSFNIHNNIPTKENGFQRAVNIIRNNFNAVSSQKENNRKTYCTPIFVGNSAPFTVGDDPKLTGGLAHMMFLQISPICRLYDSNLRSFYEFPNVEEMFIHLPTYLNTYYKSFTYIQLPCHESTGAVLEVPSKSNA